VLPDRICKRLTGEKIVHIVVRKLNKKKFMLNEAVGGFLTKDTTPQHNS
jgi:hypothetical protein